MRGQSWNGLVLAPCRIGFAEFGAVMGGVPGVGKQVIPV